MKFEKEKHRHILQNWGVISQLVCEKHNIKQKDLDILLYFYGHDKGYFKKSDFLLYRRAFPHFRNRFASYLKNGWFAYHRHHAPHRVAIYCLSTKATTIVTLLYKQLFGDLTIRYGYDKTTKYGHELTKHSHVVKSGLAKAMNEENRVLRGSLE